MGAPDPVILGADPSLRGFGIAWVQGDHLLQTERWSHDPRPCRLCCFRAWWQAQLQRHSVPFVVLEGYSYGSLQGREQLGELGGLVRLGCWEAQLPFLIIPPTSLKAVIAGKGNAPKEAMRRALHARFPTIPLPPSSDERDAWALAWVGAQWHSAPDTLPAPLRTRLTDQWTAWTPAAWAHAKEAPHD